MLSCGYLHHHQGVPMNQISTQAQTPTFEWRVKELAESKGYTISTLHRAADVGYGTIESLWNGKTQRPDLEVLKKVAAVLGVTIPDLMPVK